MSDLGVAEGPVQGTRFELRERLGAGGMGVVYRALDRERDTEVAIKLLRRLDPAAIARFKNEFRALANVIHPNLVQLYELVSTGDQWFFAMELVNGVDLLTYVRRGEAVLLPGRREPTKTPVDDTQTTMDGDSQRGTRRGGPVVERRAPPLASAEQLVRLRESVGQLVHGAVALHQAGQLHRDIKPSNVLVTENGRTVLLDFGVVAALADQHDLESTVQFVGTPAYMAPELGTGAALTEASDWYALGIILYEALAGIRPFHGDTHLMTAAKALGRYVPLRTIAPQVPRELEELCEALLAPDPGTRPEADEILRRLGRSEEAARSFASAGPLASGSEALLVGRERELAKLGDALETLRSGAPITAHVFGSSGMGKTALVAHFLRNVEASGEAVILAGRCYERESVPYKALDALMDALAKHLAALPHDQALALLPAEMSALPRVFPALKQVDAVLASTTMSLEIQDPRELRRHAFAALRDLLNALARRRPLILYIDDLQWGDADSAELLAEIIRPPEPPPMFLICSFRSEDTEGSPFLRSFLEAESDPVRIPVSRLSVARARELATALLEGESEQVRRHVDAIARESGGNPFFVTELVRHVRSSDSAQSIDTAVTLERVLTARLEKLPEEARRLLDILAVSGGPIAQSLAKRCARIRPDDLATTALLRTSHLVRTHGAREFDTVETFHDRIRETVVSAMPAETLRGHHQRLAEVLEGCGKAEPEVLAGHYEGAGETCRAASYYVAAAEQASRALAFDRAAVLYARAIELDPPQGPDGAGLRAALGDALGQAGRGREAADAFLRAAEDALAAHALEYRRRAAHQLLISGHLDDGEASLKSVLHNVGLGTPATPRRALALLLWRRLRIRLRGLRFRARDATQLSPEELARIDACWSGAVGLGVVNQIYGAEFQARHLLMALRAGEPRRVAQALAVEACFAAAGGRKNAERARRLVKQSIDLAEEIGDGEAIGWAWGSAAFLECMLGEWVKGRELSRRAFDILRRSGPGMVWLRSTLQNYYLAALYYCGDVEELADLVPDLLRDAYNRGDLYAATNVSTGRPNLAWLVTGKPDEAERIVSETITRWSPKAFLVQHHWETMARVHIALYRGDSDGAIALIEKRLPAIKKSLLLRVQLVRLEWAALRARCSLAKGAEGNGEPDLRMAEREARRLVREDAEWSNALARLVFAGVAHCRGNHEAARDHLVEAERLCDAHGLLLLAAITRLRLGQLVGGDEGRALSDRAERWMRERGIVDVPRLAYVFAPFTP